MDIVTKVAEAIDGIEMFDRFNDWTDDHVPGLPIEICSGHDECIVIARYPGAREEDGAPYLAKHLAEARARAALAAMLEAVGEPVGWNYENGGSQIIHWERLPERAAEGWTETPLYSLAALREEVGR